MSTRTAWILAGVALVAVLLYFSGTDPSLQKLVVVTSGALPPPLVAGSGVMGRANRFLSSGYL